MDGKGVEEAFEILLEELDKIFSDLSEEEAKAYKDKDFEKAKQLISDGERIRNFRKSVESLQEEWLKDHFSQCQGQEKKNTIEREGQRLK